MNPANINWQPGALRCVIYGNNPEAYYCLHYLYQQVPREHMDIKLVAPRSSDSGAGFIFSEAADNHCDIGISPQELVQNNIADIFLATELTAPGNQPPQWITASGYGFTHQRQPFFQWWQPGQQLPEGQPAASYNLNCLAAATGRCGETPAGAPALHRGLQFRHSDYCNYLEAQAQARGITVIHDTALLSPDATTGYNLVLGNTSVLQADFILDCDGASLSKAASDQSGTRPLLSIPAFRTTVSPCEHYQRSPAVHCTMDPKRWSVKIRGLQIDHQIIFDTFQTGYQSAWVQNVIGVGSALQLGSIAINPLAQAQQQLQFLLPLLSPQTDRSVQREEFNERVAQYNGQVTNLHSLCHWLAGHSRRLSTGAREQLGLFRSCGRTRQADEELISDEAWLLLPAFCGFSSRRSAFPLPENSQDYGRWLSNIASRYQQLNSTLPAYQSFLDSLTQKNTMGVKP